MLSAIIGGALIGFSASLFWSKNGRIAGISGILSGALQDRGQERWLRIAFLIGLVSAGLVLGLTTNTIRAPELPLLPLAGAGVLVGFGTRLSGGCTSGHGVCGLSRFSLRSLVAVLTFMSTGALTVYVVRHLLSLGVAS